MRRIDGSDVPGIVTNTMTLLAAFLLLILVATAVLTTIAVWKINAKAGEPGWAVFVPVYGTIVLLRIGRRPTIWVALLALPLLCTIVQQTSDTMQVTDPVGYVMLPVVSGGASLTVSIVTGTGLARAFGRSTVFGVLALGLLPVIGYPVLGFGRSQPSLGTRQSPQTASASCDVYPGDQGPAGGLVSHEESPRR